MALELNQQIDAGAVMIAHTTVILQLKERRFNIDWVHTFSADQLLDCFQRMDAFLPGISVPHYNLQQELIQNPAFAAWFAQLLALLPNVDEVTAAQGSIPGTLLQRLCDLLDSCWTADHNLTAWTVQSVINALKLEGLDSDTRLIFLENFSGMELDCAMQQAAVGNLRICQNVPLTLNEEQRWLLCEPFVTSRSLFANSAFEDIWDLLETCPELLNILRLLHQEDVPEELTLADYAGFASDAAQRYICLKAVISSLGPEAAGNFILFWQRNGCSLSELQRMRSKLAAPPTRPWSAVFSSYSGYVNMLYGTQFKSFDLSVVSRFQEGVLLYAITHGKKRFIRLVDENSELFHSLPVRSILFQEELYHEHFNLNELTVKDLSDCRWLTSRDLPMDALTPGRLYTFPELKALHGAPAVYVSLYNMLESQNQDYRLLVFRQLLKRKALGMDMPDAELSILSTRLSKKTLHHWQREELGHIADLTARDTVLLLIHLHKIQHLLPGIHTRTDALLVLENLDILDQLNSVAELKADLTELDANWRALAEDMGLSEDFQLQHRETIIPFLCSNGAFIARTYLDALEDDQRVAFQRVVKAELMGQLTALKYFEDDLQKELDLPLTTQVETGWKKNLHASRSGLEVREHDDFFATMLLGTQPQRTCLAYDDGMYRHCLLSSFDSNKKVLYAEWKGRIVGRAFLRITKGCLCSSEKTAGKREKDFTFVDLENISGSRREKSGEADRVTLFLERPYINSVGPDMVREIQNLFIKLACRKADELGTMLVLSTEYRGINPSGFAWTLYNIYISKSKAGAQYLDSLGGEATVSKEGHYSAYRFLVRKCAEEEEVTL